MENQLPVYCPCCGHIRTIMKSEFPIAKCEFCETTFLRLEGYSSADLLQDILRGQWEEKKQAIQEMLIKPSFEFRQEQWDNRLSKQAQKALGTGDRQTDENGEPVYIPKCPICGSPDLSQNSSFGFNTGRMYECNNCEARF